MWSNIIKLWNEYYEEYDRVAAKSVVTLQPVRKIKVEHRSGINYWRLHFERVPNDITVTFTNDAKCIYPIPPPTPKLDELWANIRDATKVYMSEQETIFTEKFNQSLKEKEITNTKVVKTTGIWDDSDVNQSNDHITIEHYFRSARLELLTNDTTYHMTVMVEHIDRLVVFLYPNKDGLDGMHFEVCDEINTYYSEIYDKLQVMTANHTQTFVTILSNLISV